jgi:hypothetical protein
MTEPLFISILGPAGVGKSFTVNEKLKEDPSYCMRTSTTGISAVNLGGGAMTINSALKYFNTKQLLMKVANKEIDSILKKISERFRYIVIDECSMLDAAQVDLIYTAICRFNAQNRKRKLGLYLTGDSGQLPAVSGKPFFEARYWNAFHVSYLTEVKRQSDKDFIKALQLVRAGRPEEAVDWFEENIGFHSSIDEDFEGSTFFSMNAEVDTYNFRKLTELEGVSKKYVALIEGTPMAVWKDIPKYVELKKGALITILINNIEQGYANGDMAIVQETFDTCILVKLLRTKRQVYIHYHGVNNVPLGQYKPVGSISYLPVRLSWASTIHKSQSLSLDAVQIKLGGEFLERLSGGLYTALSRVRTKEGLRIVGNRESFIQSCYVDPRYIPYIK